MKIQIRKNPKPGVAQPWSWRLVSNNGKIVSSGETHPSKGNAIRAAKGVVKEIANFSREDGTRGPQFESPKEVGGVITIIWF